MPEIDWDALEGEIEDLGTVVSWMTNGAEMRSEESVLMDAADAMRKLSVIVSKVSNNPLAQQIEDWANSVMRRGDGQ